MRENIAIMLAAATTDTSSGVLQRIPGSLERDAADIERLPFLSDMSAIMPAADLFFGGALLVFIILIHAAGVRAVTRHVVRRCDAIMRTPAGWRADLLMGSVVFMLLALHVVEIVVLSVALVYSGLVPDWRAAGFFAGNTYTTVGYGTDILPNGWRMLAPIIAMSGLFAFGWSGSVLVDFVRRINAIREAAMTAKGARRKKS